MIRLVLVEEYQGVPRKTPRSIPLTAGMLCNTDPDQLHLLEKIVRFLRVEYLVKDLYLPMR